MKLFMNRWGAIILSIVIIFLPICKVDASVDNINLFSDKAISVSAETGEVIYSKNGEKTDFPASTTKIMTAILLMEHLKKSDYITFSDQSLKQEKSNSQIIFSKGEKLDRDTALKTMMVLSANDLAYAIGERVAGNIPAFVKMMNQKAKEIGATHTHFVTPNGLHDNNHYTTPHDLALIAREAMKYPEIMTAMGTKSAIISTSVQKNKYIFNRSNMFTNPYFFAGKTGFTNEARNTLVEIDKKNGETIINVLLHSSKPQYLNDIKLLDTYAFSHLRQVKLIDKNNWHETVKIGSFNVKTMLKEDVNVLTAAPKNNDLTIKITPKKINMNHLNQSGIKKDEIVGTLEVWNGNTKLKQVNLFSEKNYQVKNKIEKSSIFFSSLVLSSIIIILSIFRGIRSKQRYRMQKRG
jgi:D-alanyl-D-alanine carboxypeptidase